MTLPNILLSLVVIVLASLPAAARADLALNGRSTVIAMGMQGSGAEKLWLSKTLIRRDMVDRGKAFTNLLDTKSREITVIDHSQRLATVYGMSSFKQQTDASIDDKQIKLNVRPTGRTHVLQKWPCVEHSLELSMPAEVGGEKLSFEMDGTVWLARNVPEHKETAAILKLMQDPDMFIGMPALAKTSPVQARGISEAIRRIAPMGLLCSVDVNLKYEGSGRMASLSKKMASRISITYDDYSSETVAKGTFDVPAGYRVVRQ